MSRNYPIRMLIVDESPIFQEGLGAIIQREADALNHTNSNPPIATILELFTQGLTPLASAGNLISTSTTSRQLQFALEGPQVML
jgi:hypothetical protein